MMSESNFAGGNNGQPPPGTNNNNGMNAAADAADINPFGSGQNFNLALGKDEEMIQGSQGGVGSPSGSGEVQMIHPGFSSGVMCINNMPNGANLGDVGTKLESLKNWSVSTYKCTKQALTEKLGKAHRTVDLEIESQIDTLRDLQREYGNLLTYARGYSNYFTNMTVLQRNMSQTFNVLAAKEPRIKQELTKNAATQTLIAKNGENLTNALQFFVNSLATLCDKTIEDTIITIRNFETSRLEYDAYRADLATLQQTGSTTADGGLKLREAESQCAEHKQKYEQLREDVQVKIKFLEENRTKVMEKQLLLFHNAISAYFSGNQTGLESTLKQFSIQPTSNTGPSFLEAE